MEKFEGWGEGCRNWWEVDREDCSYKGGRRDHWEATPNLHQMPTTPFLHSFTNLDPCPSICLSQRENTSNILSSEHNTHTISPSLPPCTPYQYLAALCSGSPTFFFPQQQCSTLSPPFSQLENFHHQWLLRSQLDTPMVAPAMVEHKSCVH